MKRFLAILFIFCLSLRISAVSQTVILAGGEMEYKSLGSGKYLITARLFRDCRGKALDTAAISFGVFAGTNGGNGCGTYKLEFKRTAIAELPASCSWSSKACSPQNTTNTGQGIEMHTFQSTVDFNSAPLSGFLNKSSCCEVTFYAGRKASRSSVITTGPLGNGMYVTCMLNVCNLKSMKQAVNNSPVFMLPPMTYHCCNTTVRENISVQDSTDSDALSFRLVSGLHLLPNSSVNYSPPYSSVYPLTPYCIPPGKVDCTPNPNLSIARGTFLDSTSGQFVITPTKCDEQGPVAVEITERRRDTNGIWRVVGRTRRDWLFSVQDDCGYNNPPALAYTQALSVCEGDTLITDIKVTDNPYSPYQTNPDTPVLHWVKNLPGAYMTCLNPGDRERTYRLFWPTKKGQGRETKYLTAFRASDNHCPRQLFCDGAMSILVKKRIQLRAVFSHDSCNRLNAELRTSETVPGFYYNWKVFDSTGNRLLIQKGGYTGKTAFPIPYAGKVFIQSAVSSEWLCGHNISDTVTILPNLWVTLPTDTMLCGGIRQKNMFIPATVQNNSGTTRFHWSVDNIPLPDDTLSYLQKLLFLPAAVKVRVSDSSGCASEAWRNIQSAVNPNVNLGIDREFCPGDTAWWTLFNQNVLWGNKHSFLWSNGETTKEINVKPHAGYWLLVTDTTTGCFARDTIQLLTMKSPGTVLGPDRRFCPGDVVLLKPVNASNPGITRYKWQSMNSTQILSFDSVYRFTQNMGSCLVLTESLVKNTGGFCDFSDTVCLIQFEPLNLKTAGQTYCYSGLPVNLTGISSKFRTTGYNASFRSAQGNSIVTDSNDHAWLNTNGINNKNLFAADYTDKIYVTVPDTGGLSCVSRDSFQIRFRHSPEMPLKTINHPSNKETLPMDNFFTTSLNRLRYLHVWRSISAPAGQDTSMLLTLSGAPNRNYQFRFSPGADTGRVGRYLFELYLRDYITGCEHKDTTYMDVNYVSSASRINAANFMVWPNPIKRGATLSLRTTMPWTSLQLQDCSGRTVYTFHRQAEDQILIDRSLTPGLYLLQLRSNGNSSATMPLLIED